MSPMDNPTAVQTPSEGLRPSDPTVSPTQAEKDACRAFRATIVDFYSESSRPKLIARPTVYDLLYGVGPKEIMDETARNAESLKHITYSGKPDIRWYHLPANNVNVQDLMRTIKLY